MISFAELTTPRWLARIVAGAGVIGTLSALSPPLHARLHIVDEFLPPLAPAVATAATAGLGMAMVALAAALRRGKRSAWAIAVAVTASIAVLHLVKGLDVEESVLSVAALGLLLLGRRHFTAAPDPRSYRHAALLFVVSMVTALVLGTLLISRAGAHRVRLPTLTERIQEVALGLIGVKGPLAYPTSGIADRVALALAVLGALALLPAILVLLRPAGGPHPMTGPEEEQLRELVDRFGGEDSLSYFALRRDRSVVFAPNGSAAVSYRVVGGTSLAAGDPIGDPGAWPQAIDDWLAQVRYYGWSAGVIGASEDGARAYQRAGLKVLGIGDEATLTRAEFTLAGRAMRPVRQAVARTDRAGYLVRIRRLGELTAEQRSEIRSAAHRWRAGSVERGFSMALDRIVDPADPEALVVTCRDDRAVLAGVLVFVPWGHDGLSLDLMRRSPGAENGIVEAMVSAVMTRPETAWVTRVSMNFATFRERLARGEALGAGPIDRLQYRLLVLGSRTWQIDSLYRASAKYQPTWYPRYLCYGQRDLAKVAVAVLRAEAFLDLRLPGRRRAEHQKSLVSASSIPRSAA